jgi:hypothetical protein
MAGELRVISVGTLPFGIFGYVFQQQIANKNQIIFCCFHEETHTYGRDPGHELASAPSTAIFAINHDLRGALKKTKHGRSLR